MNVSYHESKLVVDPPSIVVRNYPLHWIEGFRDASIDEISLTLFGRPYSEMKGWEFVTNRGQKFYSAQTITYGRLSYRWKHVTAQGTIATQYGPDSRIWRGIYYADLGVYGRLGGGAKSHPGSGRNSNFLNYRDENGKVCSDLNATNTMGDILRAHVNLLFPFTVQVPPPQVTLDYLQDHGLKSVFSLGGPKGGQPLSPKTIGTGSTSKLGSVWYNHPGPYINERHAPGEKFHLLNEVERADKHPAVLAIQQQDEPVYTDVYNDRYNLIKSLTRKPLFAVVNWGAFYNSSSPVMKAVRKKRLYPFAHVTDIYCSDPYIWTSDQSSSFRKFGDYRSNIWRLVDRHRAEIAELSAALKYQYEEPRWLVLQGHGKGSKELPDDVSLPDPAFMHAQIWGAVCLGATGIAIHLQHTAASIASNRNRRSSNPRAPLINGIAPYGPHADTWEAMSDAYRLIEKYEEILVRESIAVECVENHHILAVIKEMENRFFMFLLNAYREVVKTKVNFTVLPGKRYLFQDLFAAGPAKVSDGGEIFSFAPFELKILEISEI